MLLLRRLLVNLPCSSALSWCQSRGGRSRTTYRQRAYLRLCRGFGLARRASWRSRASPSETLGRLPASMPTPITKPRCVTASQMSCGSQLARSPIISNFTMLTEAQRHILDWRTSPFNPFWRRTDPRTGQSSGNYAFPLSLLIDKEVIPETLFAVFNVVYQPSFLQVNSKHEHDDSFVIIAGGSYALTPKRETSTRMRSSLARSYM